MRKHRADLLLWALPIFLMVMGLVVIYAIGPMRVNYENAAMGGDLAVSHYFRHQLISVVAALVAFVAAYKIPYKVTRRLAKWMMLGGLILCIALSILAAMESPLAVCQKGACRWLSLGNSVTFQPAEVLKIGLILYLAQLIAERKRAGKLERASDFWIPFVTVSTLTLGLVVLNQADMGTGVVLVAIILTMLWMSGIKQAYFWLVVATVLALGVISIMAAPHRMERLLTFSGAGDVNDTYHIENALMAIGSGGWFGVGIGNSVQATGYLPESINDSVFAVMGETFGFLGLSLIVGCFALLLARLMRLAVLTKDDEQKLVVMGVWAWVAAQVIINIAAMTGLLPLTGITLPLLSYGGTSMVFVATALGLCLQLSCYTSRERS